MDHPAAFQVEFAWQQWPAGRRSRAESLMDVIDPVRTPWTEHLQGRAGATDVAHHDTLRALRVVQEDRRAADIANLSADVGSPGLYRLTRSGATRLADPPTEPSGDPLVEEDP